jgi:competence ComEA-like helix-hairpin-helix protein
VDRAVRLFSNGSPQHPDTQAEAIVQYREQKGAFHSAEDLKKVPGFDSAKVEAIKNRLEF